MAPNHINLYGLVTSMAPNHINSYGLDALSGQDFENLVKPSDRSPLHSRLARSSCCSCEAFGTRSSWRPFGRYMEKQLYIHIYIYHLLGFCSNASVARLTGVMLRACAGPDGAPQEQPDQRDGRRPPPSPPPRQRRRRKRRRRQHWRRRGRRRGRRRRCLSRCRRDGPHMAPPAALAGLGRTSAHFLEHKLAGPSCGYQASGDRPCA